MLESVGDLVRGGRERSEHRGELREAFAFERDAELIEGLVELGPELLGADAVTRIQLGRQPEPAFGATSALLQFETRFTAFTGMLTPTQPKGLFGDGYAAGAAGAAVATADRRSPTLPLVLSSGARTLMIVMIVIGVIAAIADSVANSGGTSSNNNGRAPYYVSQHR